MVFFNYSTMQMAAKVVYYGPGLCGKTTNLQFIYGHTTQDSRGEMVSLETETDRTLFFDLLPIDVGSIAGFNTRIQLYTVPGQVFYNTTRKLVLQGRRRRGLRRRLAAADAAGEPRIVAEPAGEPREMGLTVDTMPDRPAVQQARPARHLFDRGDGEGPESARLAEFRRFRGDRPRRLRDAEGHFETDPAELEEAAQQAGARDGPAGQN